MATRSETKEEKNTNQTKTSSGYEPGKTGAVKDPEHDGRLKENRETGTTLGTTEHTAQAPNVHKA